MRQRTSVDIRELSFEKFVAFLFARDVPNESFESLHERRETAKWDQWYWHFDITFDARRVCGYYVNLFDAPRFLLESYSKAQLEQGFWAIQGSNLDCSAFHIIWDRDLPFPIREQCVKSMVILFKGLFAIEPLVDAVSMWWDSLCYDWHCGNRKRSRGGEDRAMQDVMFETLVDILELESPTCQGAALHGLSHLHHPDTGDAIRLYLARNPHLSGDWKSTALAAAEFKLM
ncbi:MAG TPA: hypothetical protein VF126_00855 [Acidobacteriaceae bacterium]